MLTQVDPIISKRRNGTPDDPYIPKIDTFTIRDGHVILSEIPDRINHVIITGYVEIYSNLPISRQFYVDYNSGVVHFHPDNNGNTVTLNYYGTGAAYFPASRVWSKLSNNNIAETLQDIVDNGSRALELMDTINETVLDLVVNVKSYGAVGDGIADDTNAIQKAINAVAEMGSGTVFLPSGTYLISYVDKGIPSYPCIQLASNLHLLGAGMDKTIIRLAAGTPEWARMLVIPVGVDKVKVSNLSIDGQKDLVLNGGNEHMAGIFLSACSNVNITDCHIYDTRGDAIQIYGGDNSPFSENVIVARCILEDTGRNGLTAEHVKAVFMEECTISNVFTAGFDSEPWLTSDQINGEWGPYHIRHNRFFDCPEGIGCEGKAVYLIDSNEIFGGNYPITIRNATGGAIRDNYCYDFQQSGITITGPNKNLLVTGNTVVVATTSAIYGINVESALGNPESVRVSRNSVTGRGYVASLSSVGVHIYGSKNTMIEDNTIAGFKCGVEILNTLTDGAYYIVKRNLISDIYKGVEYDTAYSQPNVKPVITDNIMKGSLWNGSTPYAGVSIQGTAALSFVISNNLIEGFTNNILYDGGGTLQNHSISEINNVGNKIVTEFWTQKTTPESYVSGRIGDWCISSNGKRWYKATGNNTNTGWIEAFSVAYSPSGTKYRVYINDAGSIVVATI